MKNKIKTTFATAALALTIVTTPAISGFIEDAQKVINTVQKDGSDKFCRKGNAFMGIFSSRSFNGILCKRKEFAAIVEIACANNADYNRKDGNGNFEAKCKKNAIAALGDSDPKEVIKGLGGQLKDLAIKVGAKK